MEFNDCTSIRIGGDVVERIAVLRNPTVTASKVDRVIISGDLLGEFYFITSIGELKRLQVGGDIGTPTEPTFVNAFPGINVGNVSCSNFYGGLAVGGSLRRFETSGAFSGQVVVSHLRVPPTPIGELDPGVYIGQGDLDGDVSVGGIMEAAVLVPGDVSSTGYIALGTFSASSKVEVGGEFAGSLHFSDFAGEGFQGQVVINSLGQSDPNHAHWSGEVSIYDADSETLRVLSPSEAQPDLAPYYETLSSTLGGGAVGLVPFNFHPKDSAPTHGVSVVTGAPTSVEIHHYGPVVDGDDDLVNTPPVRVFEAPLALPFGKSHHGTPVCDAIWTEVTDGFAYEVLGRVVTITNDADSFSQNRAYQVIPADLVCNPLWAASAPQVVYVSNWAGATTVCDGEDFPIESNGYGFKIASGFDLNQNLALETGDVETWLIEPVDFDNDEDADAADLGLLVDAVVNGGE